MEDSENNKNPSVGNIPNNNISEQNIQNINEHSKNENNINEHSEFQTEQKIENKEPEISVTTNEPKEKEENIIEENENENKINEGNINTENSDNNNVINQLEPHTLIKIRTRDKKMYKVQVDILLKSKLLVGLVQDYIDFIIEDDEIIELSEVDSKNFDLIIDYLQHYKDKEPKEIPKPFPERTDEEFLRGILDNDDNDWTYNFISKLSIKEAIDLTNAADYLQIKGLIDLLAAKLAHEMCNCDVEESRKKFGIECDMTEEEVAEYNKYPFDEDN